jgi:Rrf2 family protein
MQLPIKAHYATVAMLALAEKYTARDVLPARLIAREHGIPNQFLGQILQQLRAVGLISSTRGANGGFYLQRSPESITVAEVVDAVVAPSAGLPNSEATSALGAAVLGVWEELDVQQRAVLERVSLFDLLARVELKTEAMFYI